MAWSSGDVQRRGARKPSRAAQRASQRKVERAESTGRAPRVHGIAPCIAFTREPGAGAGKIAQAVATALGYTLWGSELSARVAHRLSVPVHALRGIEERSGSVLEWLRTLGAGAPSGAAYRIALCSVVAELCSQGSAVILGRGAALLVRPEQALRVRILCPLPLRVARHARRFGLDERAAHSELRAADRAQARFLSRLTGQALEDDRAYDLVLSTAELGPEAASRLVLQCYAQRFTRHDFTAHGQPRALQLSP